MPDIAAIWKRGIALRDAPDEFSPRALNGPVPTAKIEPTDDMELTGGLRMLADQQAWDEGRRRAAQQAATILARTGDAILAVGKLNHERCCYVIRMIITGKAVVTGYRNGATGSPQIVPSYLFENPAFIKWSQSAVSGNGLNYISVRITKLRRSKQFSKQKNKTAKRKIGRPSSEKYIESAIRELNNDPTFAGLLRKSQVQKVIDFVNDKYSKHFPSGKGLHESTVSRYLVKTFGR